MLMARQPGQAGCIARDHPGAPFHLSLWRASRKRQNYIELSRRLRKNPMVVCVVNKALCSNFFDFFKRKLTPLSACAGLKWEILHDEWAKSEIHTSTLLLCQSRNYKIILFRETILKYTCSEITEI